MSHNFPHHLKRLQHDINLNLHLSSHNHHSQQPNNSHTNTFDYQSRLLNDETIRESIQNFTVSSSNNNNNNNNNHPKLFRPYKPGPQQARRGGGRVRDRSWHSSLPKRAINYDLAESFMDHSTNPLSSDLYKVKFNHSTKQWSNGRFINYKEKLDKLDGNIIEITCKRTFPIVPKRKKIPENNQNATTTSLLTLFNPINQEQKKKQSNTQTNVNANLFGGGRIPRLSSTKQTPKPQSTVNSSSTNSISLLNETSKDHQS